MPATVIIPVGQQSVTVQVTALQDGIQDGSQNVTLVATATGMSSGQRRTHP